MERIERVVRYRPDRFPTRGVGLICLPQHACAGFLDWCLRRFGLAWLREAHPEDLYQAAAVFLVERNRACEVPEGASAEEVHDAILGTQPLRDEFVREARRHLRELVRSLGYRRLRGSSHYVLPGGDPRLVRRISEEEERARRQAELQANYSAVMEALEAPQDKELFRLWFEGGTLIEIAHFIGCAVGVAWPACIDLVNRIRQRLQVDLDANLPPAPPRGRVLPASLRRSGANPDTPRVLVGAPARLRDMSLERIQALFGVSRRTAWQVKVTGWYCPGHRNSTAAKASGVVCQVMPPVPPEVAAVLANPQPGSDGRVHLPQSVRTLRPCQIKHLFGVTDGAVAGIRNNLVWMPNSVMPPVPLEVAAIADNPQPGPDGCVRVPETVRTLRTCQIQELFNVCEDTAVGVRDTLIWRPKNVLPPVPSEVAAVAANPQPDAEGRVQLPEAVRTLMARQIRQLFKVSLHTAYSMRERLVWYPARCKNQPSLLASAET